VKEGSKRSALDPTRQRGASVVALQALLQLSCALAALAQSVSRTSQRDLVSRMNR
jgi:hypothetical protein